MASPEREQLEAITGALARLVRRFDELELRLARLERGQRMVSSSTPEPAVVPLAQLEVEATPIPPVEAVSPPASQPPPEEPPPIEPPAPASPPPPRERLETRVGLQWINRIGVVTIVIGIAFFFKYAVDNQWIGETGRVVLGILAGLATLAGADRLWRRGQKTFAQGIFGLGIALLYLSFYASFGFYRIVPQGLAFALMALTTALAGAIAIRYDALAVAVLGLIAGYATPVLLSTGEDRPWIFFSYLLLLDAGALAVARAKRSAKAWRSLEVLAFAATSILYAAWFDDRFGPAKRLPATVFAVAFYALFSVVNIPIVFALEQFLAAFALTAIWKYQAGAFFLSGLALAAAGLAVSELRQWGQPALAALGAFWVSYAFTAAPRHQDTGVAMAGLTSAFLLFFIWTLWRLLVTKRGPFGTELITLALNAPAYFAATYRLLHTDYASFMGLLAVALAGLHLAAGMAIWRSLTDQKRDPTPALLAGGIASAFLVLAAPIQFSGYRITLGWAVEAALLSWLAVRLNRTLVAAAGAFVFLLTLIRLDGIDAWMYFDPGSYSTLFNARFLTFLVAAVALWMAASWSKPQILAGVYYVAGHWVMLWACSLEIGGWTRRHAPSGDVSNLESMLFSILVALYGTLLIALGVFRRSRIDRFLGLGLIALVVAKLYLSDVWQLNRLYRMGAFMGLGILLLATSYLYSRHRAAIESWWKDETPRS